MCANRFTHGSVAGAIVDTFSETVSEAFMYDWISIFGVLSTVTTERDAQFQPKLSTDLSTLRGFKHIRTTAYYVSSNRL